MNCDSEKICLYYGRFDKTGLNESWNDPKQIEDKLKLIKAKSGFSTFQISKKITTDLKKTEKELQGLIAVSLFLNSNSHTLRGCFFIKFFKEDLDNHFLKADKTKGKTSIDCVNKIHYDLRLEKTEYFNDFCEFIANRVKNEKKRTAKITSSEMKDYVKECYLKKDQLGLTDIAIGSLSKMIKKNNIKLELKTKKIDQPL